MLGKRILRNPPAHFAKQMTTMKLTNRERARLAKLAAFSGPTISTIDGGGLAGGSVFNPHAPPRKQPVPELHTFKVPLVLTRYKGGTKGPVVLAHGLGVSSRIFSIDTIETMPPKRRLPISVRPGEEEGSA